MSIDPNSERIYHFDLPYEVGHFYISMGIGQLQTEGIYARLPQQLKDKIDVALTGWTGVTIEKQDIDAIDEDTWTKLANRLGLAWERRPKHKTGIGTTSGGMQW